MDILSIPERTFRRYCSRIYNQDQKTWLSITKHQLGSELLRFRSSLEDTYDISREMALDPKCENRIEALNCMNDSRLNIIKILSEYDEFVRKLPIISQPDEEQSNQIKESTLKRVTDNVRHKSLLHSFLTKKKNQKCTSFFTGTPGHESVRSDRDTWKGRIRLRKNN